jgi:hypothetical protein
MAGDMMRVVHNKPFVWCCMVLVIIFSQCTVKLTADYDPVIAEELVEIAKRVDSFYGELLETPYEERSYDGFSGEYRAIEVELRALYMKNMIRPLNEEITWIVDKTLEFWIEYKDRHAANWRAYQLEESLDKNEASEIYKDALLRMHRKRFQRLFMAMAVAEEARKVKTDMKQWGEE